MTSFALAQGVKKTGPYDLFVCGKQTTDGDTAQVGAEMAEWLGIPHVVNVKSVDAVGKDSISVIVDLPDCTLAERIPYPCLMTVVKDLDDSDPKHYGLNGSPTQVKRIFPPEAHVEHVSIDGTDAEKAAQLADLLDERKFLQ